MEKKMIRQWLHEGPFELYLGAGFFGFYAHVGFIKAVYEQNLKPQKIHGASAGAIIGAMLANSYSADQIEEIVLEIQREDFWDPGFGLGLLKGKKFHELLQRFLPESFHQLKTPLEVAVFDLFSLKNRKINSGDLCTAVRGSSAFPGLFQPVKFGNKYLMDGGLFDQFPSRETRVLAHCFAKKDKIKRNHNHFTLSLKELPRSSPNKMHLAKEIIEKAYEQTKILIQGEA